MTTVMPVHTETTTISAKLTGCTSVGTPAVSLVSAKVKGTFVNTASNGCAGLLGDTTESGSLTATWKVAVGTAKVSHTSVLPVISTTGGEAGTVASFNIGFGTPATGAYEGTDNGAGDTSAARSKQTITALTKSCSGTLGLAKISLQAPVSGPAVSLS
jgi:hypothetical protein